MVKPVRFTQEEAIRRQRQLAVEGNDFIDEEVTILEIPPEPVTRWGKIYRSAAFQIFVVAALAFTGPAMSEAITGLGGGGMAAPWVANAATCVSYVIVSVISLIGGPIASRLGIKFMLIVGAATFPINGSAYYVSSKYRVDWYLILGRAIYGFGFAFWYVAEAAIVLSYPEEGRRGKYLGLWVAARNLGQVIAGAIALARNVNNSKAGGVSTSTYLIFIAIEAVGFPVAWLISSPHQVRRADGVPIIMSAKRPWRKEMQVLWRHLTQRRMLLFFPVSFWTFFCGGVAYTYLANYFTVRTRAMSGVLQPGAVVLFSVLHGRFVMDNGRLNQKRRAQLGFLSVILPSLIGFAWMVANAVIYERAETRPAYDWTDKGWANAYLPYFLILVSCYWNQAYVYWLLSCFSADVQSNARAGGIFRFFEAAGQAISYGINSNKKVGIVPIYVNLALTVIVIPTTLMIVSSVPLHRADDLRREDIDPKAAEQGDGDKIEGDKDVTTVNALEVDRRMEQ